MKKLEIRVFNDSNSYVIPYEADCNYENNIIMCEKLNKHLSNNITDEQKQRVMLYRYEYKIIE